MTQTEYLARLDRLNERDAEDRDFSPLPWSHRVRWLISERNRFAHRDLDELFRIEGYKVAKTEACRRGRIWFASAGARRKP